METNYITLNRKIVNWEWYGDATTSRVFIHLLLMANHKPGEWRKNLILRGQHLTSSTKLSSVLGYSRSTIRATLKRLSDNQQITIKTTNKFTMVTICKYDKYQIPLKDSDQQIDTQPTNGSINDSTNGLVNGLVTNNTNDTSHTKKPIKKELKSSDNSNPPTGQKLSAQKQKDLILKDQFNQARLKFPGTKRGLDVEFDYLKKTHKKTWREIIPELLPAINNRIEVAQMKGYNQEFFAEWAHFKTYIFNSKWTESFGEVKSYFTGR
jgi:hypothetical protein